MAAIGHQCMHNYKKGQVVQAIDEVGRWEEARVKSTNVDGSVCVSFVSWSSEHDVTLPGNSECIRDIVDPFYYQQECLGKGR